jgi:tetratricopeptide (TPR) repeat protein
MNRRKALSLLETMVKEYPKDTRVLSFYANTLRQDKQYGEALRLNEQVLKLEPGNVGAMLNMASLYYQLDRPADAEASIAKAVNSGLMGGNDYSQLAFSLLVVNKNKEAARYYEKAVSMQPRNYDYYNLACAYAKENEKEKALKALRNALQTGYGSKQQIENDSDFDLIRHDEQFKELVNSIK